MDGFARRRERSKKEIRKAAWELFSQFGVEKVSIADIARKARVSPATIYNNFPGKDALAREFVATTIDRLVSYFRQVLAPDRPYREKVAAFVGAISEILTHGEPRIVDHTAFTSSIDLLNDPEIKEIRLRAKARMTDLLLELVQEGREQGCIDPDLSTEAFRAYFAAFMEIFVDPGFQHEFASNPGLVEDLGVLMVHGLEGRRGE
jgi:AcrR family transcriptional regulator